MPLTPQITASSVQRSRIVLISRVDAAAEVRETLCFEQKWITGDISVTSPRYVLSSDDCIPFICDNYLICVITPACEIPASIWQDGECVRKWQTGTENLFFFFSFFFFCSRVTAAWKKEDEVWSFIFGVGEKKEDLGHGVESGCSQNLNVWWMFFQINQLWFKKPWMCTYVSSVWGMCADQVRPRWRAGEGLRGSALSKG